MSVYVANALSFGGLLVVWSNDGALNKLLKFAMLVLVVTNLLAAGFTL